MADNDLHMWTIYQHPSDQPYPYVVRQWVVRPSGPVPHSGSIPAMTLEEARGCVPPGLHRIDRDPTDDPVIVETWL